MSLRPSKEIKITAILYACRDSTSDKLSAYSKSHTVYAITSTDTLTSEDPATATPAVTETEDAADTSGATAAVTPTTETASQPSMESDEQDTPAKPKTEAVASREKTQPIYADPIAELSVLAPLIKALTAKQTTEINSLGNRLGEIRKQLPSDASLAKDKGRSYMRKWLLFSPTTKRIKKR